MNSNDLVITSGWPTCYEAWAKFLDDCWEYDSMNPTLLREKLEGDPMADEELCLSAYYNNQLVGMMFAVRRDVRGQQLGYIKLMGVHKDSRRNKIATRLYEIAEQRLKDKGAETIRFYDVPLNYFMPGIDPRYTPAICFALKLGFKQFGESINMVTDLEELDLDTSVEEINLQKQGVLVRRATKDDDAQLKELLSEEWQLWNNEVDMAMADDPPSVHIAFINGKLRAFSVHNGNNKGTGWFGPMGTHPDMRGKGVGTILLKRCLLDMRNQGHKKAIIPWVAPIAFYSHFVNARIERVFWRMEKQLKN